jgi:superfamily II RNA helicase
MDEMDAPDEHYAVVDDLDITNFD